MSRETKLQAEIAALRGQLHDLGSELMAVRKDSARLENTERVVLGRAGDSVFGLPLSIIQEVVPVAAMKALPESPHWIAGMLNLRRALVPVADLMARVSGTPRELELTDLIVVCLDGPWTVGLVVQEVSSVVALSLDSLEAPSPDLPQAPYLSGTVRHEDELVLLLSLDRLLADSSLGRGGEG